MKYSLTSFKYYYINLLAASPVASSGFAAIGCFSYGGIYIMKNYSKLTAKKNPRIFFFENPKFLLPKTFP